MAGTMIVTEQDIKLAPGKGRIQGLESMRVMTGSPHVTYLNSKAHHYAPVHSHTEAELMVVISGRMIFNGVWCGVGSVIFVPANEEYWYATADEGCMVTLIRPLAPGVIQMGREDPAAGSKPAEDAKVANG